MDADTYEIAVKACDRLHDHGGAPKLLEEWMESRRPPHPKISACQGRRVFQCPPIVTW